MIKLLSKFILRLIGWKAVGDFPEGNKYVVIAAPHTSFLDFPIGRLYYSSLGKKVHFMVKGSYFFFPLGLILRSLGAIPVYKNNKISLADQMVEEFNTRDQFLLTIAPEGTRKKVKRWKKGFYYIAKKAEVPIVLGFLDFKNKEVGVGGLYHITDNENADIVNIMDFYKDKAGRHPELF